MSEKWIQKAIKHPGALHKELGVPASKKIPAKKLNAAAVSDAPVAEASVADDSAVSADAGSDDASEAPSVEVLPDSAPAVADEPAVVTSV